MEKKMRPYCRNNSNFTFREICCGPPIYDNCNSGCNHSCECDCNNKHFEKNNYECNCDKKCLSNHPPKPCGCKPKPPPKPKPCKTPYICLPIKNNQKCECNPFMFVMIGYMLGKNMQGDFEPNYDFLEEN